MNDQKKLQLMKKIRAAEALSGQVSEDAKFSDILAEYMEDESKPSNMDPADWKKAKDIAAGNYPKDIEAAFEKKAMKAEPGKITKAANEAYKKVEDLLPKERAAKLAAKLGKRGLKSIPIVGTGIGLADAARAASEGDYKTAGLEVLSALDPTSLTDVALAAKDIADSQADDSKVRKIKQANPSLRDEVSPMVDELGGEPDMKPSRARELVGEQDSPDLEKMDNILNYKDYLNQRKKLFGY
jgi:hypothetical protein